MAGDLRNGLLKDLDRHLWWRRLIEDGAADAEQVAIEEAVQVVVDDCGDAGGRDGAFETQGLGVRREVRREREVVV